MKMRLLLIATSMLISAPVLAQDTEEMPPIRIGPLLSGNVTRNIVDYHVSGPQRDYGFGSLFGVQADIPVAPTMSVLTGIGYYTLSFADENTWVDVTAPGIEDYDFDITKATGGTPLKTEGSFNFLAVNAMFRIEYFALGFTVGIPMTAKITNSVNGNPPPTVTAPNGKQYGVLEDISPESEEQNVLVEARIAGEFPLVTSSTGSLRLGLSAAYPLTALITIKDEDRAAKILGGKLPVLYDNFRLPSISLGLSYLFSL